jgi:hypothetical protein
MRLRTLVCSALILAFSASFVIAQGTQTGTLRGIVTTSDKATLPGTTVTIKSAALQGERTATTDNDGAYLFRGIPPGVYKVTFSMNGLRTVERTANVPLGGVAELNLVMDLAPLTEAIEVTAEAPTVLTTPTVGANIKTAEINALANRRDLEGIAQISPSVTENSPNSRQLVINGAFAYDNVFLINGVDVNDNLFGSPQNLFIEDAIQETQVLTSGIPAEYGRFSGGVVNAITKSGGNMFSGSFRTNLSNPTWSTLTPFDVTSGVTHTSDFNETYEGTLGGPIVKDKLWFFAAGRLANSQTQKTFSETGVNYVEVNNNKRGEAKVTASPTSRNTFQLSYINNSTDVTVPPFDFSIDPHTIYNGTEPNWILGATWRGVLKSNLLAEVGYSQRKFSFQNEGGTSTNIVDSPMITLTQAQAQFNAPYFDATDPEHRNNQQFTGNLSYSMSKAGHHDFKGGYEFFRSQRIGGNSQSATSYVFFADYATDAAGKPLPDANGFLIPVFSADPANPTLILNWLPQRGATLNVDTHSVFVEDHWAITRMLSADIGVRYERVRSKATGGILGVDTNTVVPRLAAAFDPMGNGRTVFHVTYGHYAGKYNESQIGGNNNVGNPNLLLGVYTGPEGQGRDFGAGFDPANYQTVFGRFPTANVSIAPGLSSPLTKEFTVSAGTDITRRGNVQATYVWRKTDNMIEDFIDIANGTTTVTQSGISAGPFTNSVFTNSNIPTRAYQGLVFQGRYSLLANWMVAGNVTVQLKNDGNYEGEATNQPAITSVIGDYPGANGLPSIYDPARAYPTGRLQDFQRTRARIWTIYSHGIGRFGQVSASGMVRVDSGGVYSLAATGQGLTDIQNQLLAQEGYPDSPSSQTIYFADRGTGSFNGYALLDTSFNYDIRVFKSVRPWVKLDIYNLLNNQKLISFNTTVRPDPNSPTDSLGLPTGFIQGSKFGQATSASNFPIPFQGQTGGRTFRFAVGVRF